MDRDVRKLFDDINAEFDRLAGVALGPQANFQGLAFEYGNLAKAENDAPPKLVVLGGTGQFDPGKGTGGVNLPGLKVEPGKPPIAVIVPRITFWIWGCDSQACWDIFRILGVAVRNKAGGPNTRWREFQEPAETDGKWMDDGAVLIVTLDVDVALYGQVDGERAVRAVLSHTHSVSLLTTLGDSGGNPLTP